MFDSIDLDPDKWIVGLSGGVDSVVLLDLLCQVVEPESILAVHVNHHMHSKAYEWAAFSRQYAESWGVDYHEAHVSEVPPVGQSVESFLRERRYAIFAELVGENDCLLTAHHLDDQVETLLHNLFRGAGIKGLAAMPSLKPFSNGLHARPLLDMRKSELVEYAKEADLDWIEDPSNEQTQYDRNFIRHELIPMLASRYGGLEQNIARTASHCYEAQSLLDQLAGEKIDSATPFDLSLLNEKSHIQQKWLLRFWLAQNGMKVSRVQLDELLKQLKADSDKQVTFENQFGTLKRFDGALHRQEPNEEIARFDIDWDGSSAIHFADNEAPISKEQLVKIGLDVSKKLRLTSKEGSIRIKPKGRVHSTTLKKALYEKRIPPWQRQRAITIYQDDEPFGVYAYLDAALTPLIEC